MTMSAVPSAACSSVSSASFGVWNRDSCRICDRELAHPLGERVEVLLGQQRRRHQHGHLLAVLHRLERRAHRDLGLAVADVAADQPVHRDGLLHVVLDLLDRGELVGRLGVREGVLQLALPRGVRAERVPLGAPAGPRRAGSAGRRSRGPPCGPGPWPSASRSRPSCAGWAARRRRSGTAGRAGRWARTAGRRAGRAWTAAYSITRYSRSAPLTVRCTSST